MAGANSAITESPAKVTRSGSCVVGWRPPGGRVVGGAVGTGAVVSADALVLPPSSVHAAATTRRGSTSAQARRRRPDIGLRLVITAVYPAAGPGTTST
jgi:hypothetical protein